MAAGFDPLVCTDGADALQAIAAQNFDLVVLDLGLPEVDGWAILGRLRAEPRTSRVPVLIVTARDDAETLQRARLAGANGYLSNPSTWTSSATWSTSSSTSPDQSFRGPCSVRIGLIEQPTRGSTPLPQRLRRCGTFSSMGGLFRKVRYFPPNRCRRSWVAFALRRGRLDLRRFDPIGQYHTEAGTTQALRLAI